MPELFDEDMVVVVRPTVRRVVVSRAAPGPQGPAGPAGPQNLFIAATAPVTTQPTYLWIEAFANGDLTMWVETGQ